VGARLLLFGLIQQSVGPYMFAPDQQSFELLGQGLLDHMRGVSPMPVQLRGTLQLGFPFMNAVAFLLFGPALAAVPIVNIFLGTWVGIPVYHTARLVVPRSPDVARWAAVLTLFFPSLLLWSVLNVREAPAILLAVLAVYYMVGFQHRSGFWDVAGAIVALALLSVFREYLTVLIGGSAVAGILMGRSRSPVRSFVVGVGLFVILVFLARNGLAGPLTEEPSLARLEFLRQDLTRGAGSAYGESANVSTVVGALRFLPVGIVHYLFAPFPWAVRSTLQAFTLPETVLWYLLIPFGIRGVWLVVRHDPRAFTVLGSTLVVVSFAYALVEGNVGTAYRHRAVILPIAFVFCALGLRDYWAVRMARRKKMAQMRARTIPGNLPHPLGHVGRGGTG